MNTDFFLTAMVNLVIGAFGIAFVLGGIGLLLMQFWALKLSIALCEFMLVLCIPFSGGLLWAVWLGAGGSWELLFPFIYFFAYPCLMLYAMRGATAQMAFAKNVCRRATVEEGPTSEPRP